MFLFLFVFGCGCGDHVYEPLPLHDSAEELADAVEAAVEADEEEALAEVPEEAPEPSPEAIKSREAVERASRKMADIQHRLYYFKSDDGGT